VFSAAVVAALAGADPLPGGARAQAKPAASPKNPSRLPIPRFVSLKSNRVNVRRGPSKSHRVTWVFSRKGLPVEIVAEFDNWRRIRDSEGEEGWVSQALLTGERTALIAPWLPKQRVRLYSSADTSAAAVAIMETGVLGRVSACDGDWCTFSTAGYRGWIQQDLLWGVYPGEKLKP